MSKFLDAMLKSQVLCYKFDVMNFGHRKNMDIKMEVDQLIPTDSWPPVSHLLKTGPTLFLKSHTILVISFRR